MVYARKLYLITSTNLCPETIIEAKTTLESIWPPKKNKFTYNYYFRNNYVKIFYETIYHFVSLYILEPLHM